MATVNSQSTANSHQLFSLKKPSGTSTVRLAASVVYKWDQHTEKVLGMKEASIRRRQCASIGHSFIVSQTQGKLMFQIFSKI